MIEIPTLSDEENLPTYATLGASGADVRAKIESSVVIPPRKSALIPTGLFFEIPQGYEIQVRPRSGLALKEQITVLNSPGTIDADYRGELKVILINHGEKDFEVTPNMRIAQVVVTPVVQARFVLKKNLGETSRGGGGFGSTGVK
jgi:dUTP pyrophosphatase